MPDDGMRLVLDDAQKALKATRTFAINEVADAGPLREAQRTLGIRSK
jgi:ribosomal protein L13E